MECFDFDEEWKDIGLVLDQFEKLERKVARAIRLYIQPKADRIDFVEGSLLHHSIVPFAMKTKLLLALVKEFGGSKLSREKMERVLQLRNSLAHDDGPDDRSSGGGRPGGVSVIELSTLIAELELDLYQLEQRLVA